MQEKIKVYERKVVDYVFNHFNGGWLSLDTQFPPHWVLAFYGFSCPAGDVTYSLAENELYSLKYRVFGNRLTISISFKYEKEEKKSRAKAVSH